MPDATSKLPEAITYETLLQRHETYDATQIRTLEDLYKGGFPIMRRARDYLPKMHSEAEVRYKERIDYATYRPYFGQIVDQFSSDVFEKSIEITPQADAKNKATPGTDTTDTFYTEFAKNADGKGTAFVDILKGLLTTALKHQRAILVVDAPKVEGAAPLTRAEEDERGLARLYVYELPVECLIDWEYDDDGNLLWAIIHKLEKKRPSPIDKRDTNIESFTVWIVGDDGKAEWARYEAVYKDNEKPQDVDNIKRVDFGRTNFDAIPLHFLDLPFGLWCGNKIGPLALEHFRRLSLLIGGENRSLNAIPVAALGSEFGNAGGATPSEAQQNPARADDPHGQFWSRGYLVTGKDDKVYYVEPSGACYALTDAQLKELRDDMFAVNHQMAASVRVNTTALGRSGLSKQSDKESTAKVDFALGHIVREFAVEIFDCIARARNDKTVLWTAHGLDDYDPIDREQLLEEITIAEQIAVAVGSATFEKLHRVTLARRLQPNATAQEFDVICDEIESDIGAKQEMRDIERDAKIDELKNPPTPTVKTPAVRQP